MKARNNSFDLLGFCKRHTMLTLAVFCLLCTVVFDQSSETLIALPEFTCVCIAAVIAVLVFLFLQRKSGLDFARKAAIVVFSGVIVVCIGYMIALSSNPVLALMLCGVVGLFLAGVVLQKSNIQNKLQYWLLLIIALGLLLRLGYVLYTSIYERQHDFHNFSAGNGHAAYILYLLENGSLPDFDPREVFQFYHPPLYHTIAALWLKVSDLLSVGWDRATESLQFITLFCSGSCIITTFRIGQELKLKKTGLVVSTALVSCHPIFFLLAGSVNNDIMSIAFGMGAILWTIRWYHSPNYKNILAIALCIGLGMMTKLSIGMVAPAVAIVFLTKLIEERKHPLRTIGQFGAFGVVCCPLGLWWSIRNLVKFGMPISYVPDLGTSNHQYIGFRSVWERLFSTEGWSWDNVFVNWGDPYYDFQPILGLFKTALFDEQDLTGYVVALKIPCVILFYLSALLILVTVVGLVIFVFVNRRTPVALRALVGVLYLTLLYSYITFCFAYPHTCTMNARYVVPLIALGCVMVGWLVNWLRERQSKPTKVLAVSITGVATLFCILSAEVYTVLALNG